MLVPESKFASDVSASVLLDRSDTGGRGVGTQEAAKDQHLMVTWKIGLNLFVNRPRFLECSCLCPGQASASSVGNQV